MYPALVSAQTASRSGTFTLLLVLTVVLIVGVPLYQKLRKSVSANRRRRWVEEGLMDPPSVGTEPEERSD